MTAELYLFLHIRDHRVLVCLHQAFLEYGITDIYMSCEFGGVWVGG